MVHRTMIFCNRLYRLAASMSFVELNVDIQGSRCVFGRAAFLSARISAFVTYAFANHNA